MDCVWKTTVIMSKFQYLCVYQKSSFQTLIHFDIMSSIAHLSPSAGKHCSGGVI